EMEATSRLEAMLNRIDGVRKISSTSGNGWGHIQLEFHKDKEMDIARFEVSTVIRQTWSMLPGNVSYPAVSQSRIDRDGHRPLLTYTVNASAAPYEIQTFVENTIKPQLALMEWVAQVDVRGAVPMVWRLAYAADVRAKQGLTLREIHAALSGAAQLQFLDINPVGGADQREDWIQVAVHPSQESVSDLLKKIGVRR